jgi:cobalt-zinc-cadmium efflux system membrane fusion protein
MKTVFLFLIGIIIFGSCETKGSDESEKNLPPNQVSLTNDQLKNISVDTAKVVAEEEDLTLTGKISFDESKVGKVYPLVGGNVLRVNVALGDYVHKGQLLAVIRSTEINDLQSQFLVATNNEMVAEKNLEIAEELYKTNVNSETQLLSVRNDYSRAQAETNRLKQALSVYGAASGTTDGLYNVFSPMEGFVVEKNVNEEMEIRSDNGTNIFTVSALNTVWVLADVYESDLSKIRLNDEVDVTTIAYEGKIFKGTIDQIGNLLDAQTKTMKIRIVMANPDNLLKPEMFAVVKVHIAHPDKVVSIPSAAVLFDNNLFYVMVRKDQNTFEKRQVVLGPILGKNTYIKDGIKEGDIFVTEGSLLAESNNF